jgi:hypothetical protein
MAAPSQFNPFLSPIRFNPLPQRQFPGVRGAIGGGGLSFSALLAYGDIGAQPQASSSPSPQRG